MSVLADHPGGDSAHDRSRRHIAAHDCIGPDYGIVVHQGRTQDDGPCPDLDSASNYRAILKGIKTRHSKSGVLANGYIIADPLCDEDHSPKMLQAQATTGQNCIWQIDPG